MPMRASSTAMRRLIADFAHPTAAAAAVNDRRSTTSAKTERGGRGAGGETRSGRMTHDDVRTGREHRTSRRTAIGGCLLAAAMAGGAGAEQGQPAAQAFRLHTLARGPHRISAREYPGSEPALVLMHGFPDDLQLYDRLVPQLAGRRVILFDFLGWGRSDKPDGYPYTFENLQGDLDAVIAQLQLS